MAGSDCSLGAWGHIKIVMGGAMDKRCRGGYFKTFVSNFTRVNVGNYPK